MANAQSVGEAIPVPRDAPRATTDPSAAAVVGVGLALAFGTAAFIPALAALVVWPLLFIVPGWVVMAAVRPRISAAGRLGLTIVLSVALSAHLVYWLSIALGSYNRASVFAAAVILAAPIPVAVYFRGR